ncbi:MAG: NAD-dependent epimerase/dehydratase family protein [Candidatus Methylomirabilales bacterium]
MATLVTCGTGFVSRAFVRALRAEGECVHVLIRDGSKASWFSKEKVFVGDVFDRSSVERAVRGVETIVHVPPRVYPNGDEPFQLAMHRQAHVETTRLVLDEAISKGVGKFLFVSSAHAGGRSPDRILCEFSGGRPQTPYAQAKLEAEEVARSYAQRYAIEVAILRPPGIYGSGDKSVVSLLYRAALLNLWLPFKGLDVFHSLVFVDNLARAGLALLKATGNGMGPGAYIVKDPVDYRPADLYGAVCKVLGKRVRLFQAPLPFLRSLGLIGNRCRNIPKLRGLSLCQHLITPQQYCGHLFNETVPDFPFIDLDEAIRATVRPLTDSREKSGWQHNWCA